MVLVSAGLKPSACLEFEADICVLYHNKSICRGFQTVVHVGNVRQTAIITKMSKVCLCQFVMLFYDTTLTLCWFTVYYQNTWSWSLGSQPTGDLVINPTVGCRYFPPGPGYLPSWTASPLPWPVPNYAAWWQRYTGVSSLPKATTQCSPCPVLTNNVWDYCTLTK